MIGLTDFTFWGLVAVVVVVRRALSPRGAGLDLLFMAATVLCFGSTFASRASYFGLFVASAGLTLAVWILSRRPSNLGLAGVIALATSLFLTNFWFPTVTGRLDQLLPLVGVPYVYLRAMSLAADIQSGKVEPTTVRPLTVFSYLLPFHQLVAGPIGRYPEHLAHRSGDPEPMSTDLVLEAFNRITNGFVKKLILCELLLATFGFRFERTGWALALEIAAHALFFYLDFSGYMDIIIGVGRLVGWPVPENFDWPYGSRNIVEFWAKWHITLGTFVRDYLFTPTNFALQRGVLRGRPLVAGIACYVVSMTFVGVWHHPSVQFLCWGLLHAGGIAVFKLYEAGLKRQIGNAGVKRYRESQPARWAGTALTFGFVALSFLLAVRPPAEVLSIVLALFR